MSVLLYNDMRLSRTDGFEFLYYTVHRKKSTLRHTVGFCSVFGIQVFWYFGHPKYGIPVYRYFSIPYHTDVKTDTVTPVLVFNTVSLRMEYGNCFLLDSLICLQLSLFSLSFKLRSLYTSSMWTINVGSNM